MHKIPNARTHPRTQIVAREGRRGVPLLHFFFSLFFVLFWCLSATDNHEHTATVQTRTSTPHERKQDTTAHDRKRMQAGTIQPPTSANGRGQVRMSANGRRCDATHLHLPSRLLSPGLLCSLSHDCTALSRSRSLPLLCPCPPSPSPAHTLSCSHTRAL